MHMSPGPRASAVGLMDECALGLVYPLPLELWA